MSDPGSHPELSREAQAIWEHNASWWDERVGEGDTFQKELVIPAMERLLQTRPGQYLLDLACGNGLFSRRLAAAGCRVLACDFCPTFLECAKARTIEHGDRIDYRLIDLTDRHQLLGLGERGFHAAVCNMAIMDMATIGPLLEALPLLLKPGGRFVFSVLHPCFNSTGCTMVAELEDRGGELRTLHAVKVARYLSVPPEKGVGKPGQPTPHYYFHRPLRILLTPCFQAGFVLTGLEEPAFPQRDETRTLNWESYPEIPPILVARLERRSAE
jgi:2-polyprenyl-3-methyl-5-hydroxy-6-metoxy-1,4-benzoquinol methylase